MHWNTHAYHNEYSVDHFDHYRLNFVPNRKPTEEPEGIGLWLAVILTLVLSALIALIMVVLA
jgi:hypothetical protein